MLWLQWFVERLWEVSSSSAQIQETPPEDEPKDRRLVKMLVDGIPRAEATVFLS